MTIEEQMVASEPDERDKEHEHRSQDGHRLPADSRSDIFISHLDDIDKEFYLDVTPLWTKPKLVNISRIIWIPPIIT